MLLQYYVFRVLCYYATMLLQYYVIRVLCCYVTMLLQYYVFRVLCCYVTMLLQCYVIRVLCCYITMLLQCYVIRASCCCVIMLSGYYTIAILQQSLFYIYADYQYITIFIKQRIQLYYNNLHTIIWYRLICNICKSGCHSTIQHKNFQYWIFKFRQMTKYQALHSHDIQLCIHVCHKQTDIYIFHQANMTLFYSYKWAWGHNPL